MTLLLLLQQAVLFAHVIAFALTVSMVLREDWHLIKHRRVDTRRMAQAARAAMLGLSVLWTTGIALVILGAATSTGPWVLGAKLLAKLIVVGVLTINGVALHAWVFPWWSDAQRITSLPRLWLAAPLGAISGASWLCASFIGVARHLSPWMSLADFMALYGVVIGSSVAMSLVTLWSWSASERRPSGQEA
jgi:hypothetical protein